jgi:hypothetical protein
VSVEAHTALLDADLVQDRRRRWGSELLFYATLGALVFAGFIALRGVWPPPALRDLDRGTMTVPQ